jgi:isopenicillin N synthase-like dioxygenase
LEGLWRKGLVPVVVFDMGSYYSAEKKSVECISLEKLANGEQHEHESLRSSFANHGFCVLQLRKQDLEIVEDLYTSGNVFFGGTMQDKMESSMAKSKRENHKAGYIHINGVRETVKVPTK